MENDDMKKFALALVEEFEDHPPLKGHLMPSEMMHLWRYMRVFTKDELVSLMTLGSLIKDTTDPMGNFVEMTNLWLTEWHNSGRGATTTNDIDTGAIH